MVMESVTANVSRDGVGIVTGIWNENHAGVVIVTETVIENDVCSNFCIL